MNILRGSWVEFVKDNRVQEQDICVFVPTKDARRNFTFTVHLLRVAAAYSRGGTGVDRAGSSLGRTDVKSASEISIKEEPIDQGYHTKKTYIARFQTNKQYIILLSYDYMMWDCCRRKYFLEKQVWSFWRIWGGWGFWRPCSSSLHCTMQEPPVSVAKEDSWRESAIHPIQISRLCSNHEEEQCWAKCFPLPASKLFPSSDLEIYITQHRGSCVYC